MSINISEAESAIMKIFWESEPLTCNEVVAALAGDYDWQEPTVKTLINRLLNKGALRSEKDGRRFLYWPVLTREEWLSTESESMLDKLFDGRLAPLVAHFGAQKKISRDELAELKALIERMNDE
jgi:predicted transcriptional regulator